MMKVLVDEKGLTPASFERSRELKAGLLEARGCRAEEEVRSALDLLGTDAIRVCEGAADENPYASLAVTMSRLHRLLGSPQGRFILRAIACTEDTLPAMDTPVLIYVASMPPGRRWNLAERRAHGPRKWSWAGGKSGWAPEEASHWMELPGDPDPEAPPH